MVLGLLRREDRGKRNWWRELLIFGDEAAYFDAAETVSLLRPFARRRLRTLRPFFVDMRLRKPWSASFLRFDGWNVLFIVYLPE
jgi:hypothetical protein